MTSSWILECRWSTHPSPWLSVRPSSSRRGHTHELPGWSPHTTCCHSWHYGCPQGLAWHAPWRHLQSPWWLQLWGSWSCRSQHSNLQTRRWHLPANMWIKIILSLFQNNKILLKLLPHLQGDNKLTHWPLRKYNFQTYHISLGTWVLRGKPQNLTDEKYRLVPAMAWRRQTTSHCTWFRGPFCE